MGKKLLNKRESILFAGIAIIALIVFCLSSCNKQGAGCLSGTGTIIQQERFVEDFDTIIANENPDIILTQDTVNRVIVEAGEKVIDGITTIVSNRQLQIDNHNSCNWVRSYDKPLIVHVHVKNLRKIWYLSAGNITSTNTLTPESLLIDIWGGCGSIDLSLNVIQGNYYEHLGTADLTLRGRSVFTSVVLGEFGFFQMKDLSTDYSYVANLGTNDCYVQVNKYLDATIRSIGSIYYTGATDTVKVHISGSGQVIEF